MAAERRSTDDTCMDGSDHTCPECHQGDLISISMNVGETGLSFTTCHLCEAKWWYRDGESVPFRSVIGGVISQQS